MTFLLLFLLNWQQRVAYKISGKLDIDNHTLSATEYLTYYNYSPVILETLYLHLYANAYRDNNTTFARELKKMGSYKFLRAKRSARGGIDIISVTNTQGDSLDYEIDETIMAVILDKPLPNGDSIVLKIESILKIPQIFSRLGYKGRHYEIVQWYPKFCVFDEKGWHKQGYHAIGEFYGEFGDFEVTIELPREYVVAGTGLVFDSSLVDENWKRVRFSAENVHDFALVCDPDFEIEKREIDGIIVEIYYTKRFKKEWKRAGDYAVDAVSRYNRWFGIYPYKKLSVVQGYGGGGMEYPNLVIVGGGEDNITRQFELIIIHDIAHQWFYGILGSNEMDEAWLDEGLTSYTEQRYFIDKYGINNSFFKSNLIPELPHIYINKFLYYVTLTNQMERPILTPASDFVEEPIVYQSAVYSKPALFLRYLEGYLGSATFDSILRTYFEEFKFCHPKTEDFVKICEEVSGKDLKQFFFDFLHTTKYCDWYIKEITKKRVIVENRGEFLLPTEMLIQTDGTAQLLRIEKQIDTFNFANVKKVSIDPYNYTPEPDRWNNFSPRRFAIKPVLAWPSFDTYQVYFLPYLWYDSDDGFTPGIYLAGAQFIDADFIKGKNQWLVGYTYGTKSHHHNYNFGYQTPLVFKRGNRLRIFFKGSNGNDEMRYQMGLANDRGIPFTTKPMRNLKTFITYNNLKSFAYVDSVDWSKGRYLLFQNQLICNSNHCSVVLNLRGTGNFLNEEWNFLRVDWEFEKKSKFFLPRLYLRTFASKIFGSAPLQERIFLSGGLRQSFITDLFFGQKGYTSPQEHIHIKQDGNMPGYQGYHIKTDGLFCINLELPEGFPLRLFGDFGYYYDTARWQNCYDAGGKLVFGPVYFILPIINAEKFFPKNWSIGISGMAVGF
uniref:M1 family peptidase n=1 Tax=candidate division WOR-3 bacterium TaxID=2052148 RepID=A0A7C4TGR3_UNCW3